MIVYRRQRIEENIRSVNFSCLLSIWIIGQCQIVVGNVLAGISCHQLNITAASASECTNDHGAGRLCNTPWPDTCKCWGGGGIL